MLARGARTPGLSRPRPLKDRVLHASLRRQTCFPVCGCCYDSAFVWDDKLDPETLAEAQRVSNARHMLILKDQKKASEQFYGRLEVAAAISILCGLLTVLTNNSGPIFNIYLLNCGLSMNQFVATRAVLMAGKNVAKVGARLVAGSISVPVIIHGLQIGVMCLVGIQCAKPIKDRTSPQLYKFFTWGVLLYTAVKMWFA